MAKIDKIMDTSVPNLNKEANVSDAAKLIAKKPHGCIVVVEGKKPVGIITESDIVKHLISKKINPKEKVTKIMSSPIIAIHPNTKLEKALEIIDTKHFGKYPVIENESLIGVVTENDVVHSINDNIKFHRNLQNAVLIIFVIFEFFNFLFLFYMNT